MKKLLDLTVRKLYKGLKPVLYRSKNQKVIRALGQLNPRRNEEELYDEYQIRRLMAVIVVLIVGIVSAVLLHLCSRMEQKLTEGGSLIRNEWGAGDYRVRLWAEVGNWGMEIPFLVKERQFSEEEKSRMLSTLQEELPTLIKEENQDLQHITKDLNLVSSVEGYPFRLTWHSENSERVRRDGKVNRTGIMEGGESVILTVEASYEGESNRFNYEVLLMPEMLNEQERFFRDLSNTLSEVDAGRASKKELPLPSGLRGRDIIWKEKKADNGIWLIVLALAGSVLIGRGMENDLMRNCQKRDRQLMTDYPDFVSKLRLYLSAGLTVKNAFTRIASDYGNGRRNEHRKIHYLYEEMRISCYQLENGMTEERAYQDFGRRCGQMQYRRLGFLLSVHLKQGNSQLLTILSQEADNAQEDKRNMARKAGEETGTKLLLPMMLMLIVIMFLVLMPAYMDFGNI